MSLPLFDPIELPPNTILIDINSIEDEKLRTSYQSQALALYMEEEELELDAVIDRDWDPNEGAFLCLEDGEPIGICIVLDVEEL